MMLSAVRREAGFERFFMGGLVQKFRGTPPSFWGGGGGGSTPALRRTTAQPPSTERGEPCIPAGVRHAELPPLFRGEFRAARSQLERAFRRDFAWGARSIISGTHPHVLEGGRFA